MSLENPTVYTEVPRVLNDGGFVLSEEKTVHVKYYIDCVVSSILGASTSVDLTLMVSPPSGTPVPYDSVHFEADAGGGLLGTVITRDRKKVDAFVPPNHTIEIRASGTGSYTYIGGTETIF